MPDSIPGRALAAWMDDAARQRLDRAEPVPALPDYAAVLADRPPLDQSGLIAPLPQELEEHGAALRASEGAQRMLREGWELALITDLRRVIAAQSRVSTARSPADGPDPAPSDLPGVARLTLPLSAPVPEITQELNEADQTWTISSPNPNLRISGAFGGEVAPGVHGFGFLFAELPSYLSLAEYEGRHVLRDGYHRAYRLIVAGIVRAPAFVRRLEPGEALLRGGLIAESALLSDRPPTLADFHDDRYAVDIRLRPESTTAQVRATPASLSIGTIAR